MSTVFVTLSDAGYFPKASYTIRELQGNGQWTGDIVLIAVEFDPIPMEGVTVLRTAHIDTDNLMKKLRANPIRPMPDNRHFGKLYQWDKLQVFKEYFRKWERVVFLDAGIRIFHSIQPLLDLEWRGKFLAPDDSQPYDNGSRFKCQLDLDANPDVTADLFSEYQISILDERYFINCMFVYDTSLLDRISFDQLECSMNRYPISICNEMGILNLIFAYKLKVWQPFPTGRVNGTYIYGWSENNYRESCIWKDFHFLKYSSTA
jgi:hypothetical protein